ncbi:immunoglobulin superfamily member 1-like isoform X2 [Hemitrygon akajei]|uniref:immunoglobulin superfamily member 1-like isoform X2 n=1 Tax=Hemitrygon akajei TaxID=2704970 RepID=UPI003BF97302
MLLLAVLLIAHASGFREAAKKEAPKPSLHVIQSSPRSALGDSVIFTCIAPGPDPPTHFMRYKEGSDLRFRKEVGNSSDVAFEIQIVTIYDSGVYSCRYQISKSVLSTHSDYVHLTATEMLWSVAVGIQLMIVFILHMVVLITWILYPDYGEDSKKHKAEMAVQENV